MRRIGILISGRGSNMESLVLAAQSRRIEAEIAVVISNDPHAKGIDKAQALGVDTICVPSRGLSREEHEARLVAELKNRGVDLVCLAGYMRLLTPVFVGAFPQSILNIHPSLLPAFPGIEAQQKALEYGVKISGCTVHFVDESMDHGPIIRQATVPVRDDDTPETLSMRILSEEHRIYTEAVRIVVEDRYRITGRRVLLK